MKKFVDESWLVLVLGVVFAVLLAATQQNMTPKIEANKAKTLNEAIAAVVPAMDPEQQAQEFDVDGNRVFKCLDSDRALAGWAVQNSGGGFIDMITLVVGLTPDFSEITGIQVVSHLETPGLGNKIEAGNPFPEQFSGMQTDRQVEVIKGGERQGWQVQAITGATWSSRYVADIVNEVIQDLRPELEQLAAENP